MIDDFLKHHNLPYPPHIDGWREFEHVRVLRFKGDINSVTLPSILEFKQQMERAGLPRKNTVIDGAKITDVDSSTVAALLLEMKQACQKIALINVPAELKSFLAIFHQSEAIPTFASEEEALKAYNVPDPQTKYLPAMKRTLKRNKALTLLISLLLFLIALPFFEENMMGIIYLAFFSFVLLSGIYAVSYNMRHVAGGILLAAPTLITAWSNIFLADRQILNAEMAFLTIFLCYTLAVILLHILSVKKVTINELYGAICVYIMIGMTFGVVYALLESLFPGSLSFPPEEKTPKMTSFFYFSFVSMSSTGFSGFTAVSAFARSIVIVQVIIGVMYVSALIGKLVSANTPDDGGLFDNMEKEMKFEIGSQELAVNYFKQRPLLLVLSMAMFNYATSVLMTVLSWPFFIDSWGTSLAVVLGGLPWGILSGILYNVVMAATFWGMDSWVWAFCSVWIAILTAIFHRAGWIDLHQPAKLLGAGIIMGLLNSVAVAIVMTVTDLPLYHGVMSVNEFFLKLTGNPDLASIVEKVAVEVADKTISLLLVAVAVIFIRDFFNWNRKNVKV